jgi:hypothetical protein
MRVILNDRARVALGWESEGQIIRWTIRNGRTMAFPRYGVILPTRDFKGVMSRRKSCHWQRSCKPTRASPGSPRSVTSTPARS